MEVKYDPSVTSLETIIETVSDLGYEALQWETSDAEASAVKATNERVIQITIDGMLGYVHVIFKKGSSRILTRSYIVIFRRKLMLDSNH
jgi:hypothetical protein